MAKLFKGLLITVVMLLIIVAIGLFFVANNLGSIIKTGVNDHGAELIGVPVALGSADINLFEGRASLGNLMVANPAGFSAANAFEIKRIDVQLNLESLLEPVIVIDRIGIDGAVVNAEQKGTQTNLQVLKNKIDRATKSANSSSASNQSDDGKTDPKIAIGLFEFNNASASVKSDRFGDKTVDIPSVSLNKIGTPENGLTPAAAAQAILQPLMKKVIAEVQRKALNDAVDKEIDKALDKALGDKAGKYKDKLKGLFGK